MAKKTNLEIYNAAAVKWDKARRPDQSRTDFKLRYEEARLEWLKLKMKDFEVTEFTRMDLLPFLRQKDFGTTNRVYLRAVLPDIIFARTQLTGVYKFECNGKITPRTLPIIPRRVDSDIFQDPFNQPIDTDPVYYDSSDATGQYIQILSTSVPEDVTLRYVKHPAVYDLILNPNGYTEEGEAQQNEIIDIAVQMYLQSIRDFETMQAQQLELQSKGM